MKMARMTKISIPYMPAHDAAEDDLMKVSMLSAARDRPAG